MLHAFLYVYVCSKRERYTQYPDPRQLGAENIQTLENFSFSEVGISFRGALRLSPPPLSLPEVDRLAGTVFWGDRPRPSKIPQSRNIP